MFAKVAKVNEATVADMGVFRTFVSVSDSIVVSFNSM
jgi:hypothetical protein